MVENKGRRPPMNRGRNNNNRGRSPRRDHNRDEKPKEEWIPKTDLGKLVKKGEITTLEEIYNKGLVIMEHEIVDKVSSIDSDLLFIGQAKGKFGGGKRRVWRQTQRKTAEGNVPSFSCLAVVGDGKKFIGMAFGKSKETLPAREKALRKAKVNMIKINKGCGSFDCGCDEGHSIPFKVEGKVGSVRIELMPAPKGTGLVVDDECKKILKLVGIKDVYSKTFGKTQTKYNLAFACMKALEQTTKLVN